MGADQGGQSKRTRGSRTRTCRNSQFRTTKKSCGGAVAVRRCGYGGGSGSGATDARESACSCTRHCSPALRFTLRHAHVNARATGSPCSGTVSFWTRLTRYGTGGRCHTNRRKAALSLSARHTQQNAATDHNAAHVLWKDSPTNMESLEEKIQFSDKKL